MKQRPNILFILTDQQHARMLGCAGNPHVRTPALDGLAAGGVRFDRAYCTNPACVPSRFSLMTGRMPSEIGMISNDVAHVGPIPEDIQQAGLGHLVSRAGYEAVYAGKVHLPKMTAGDVGFNYICADERDDMVEACTGFLSERHDKPFFLVASLINPHDICYMGLRDFAETEFEHLLVRKGAVECGALDSALARPEGMTEEAFFTSCCPPLPPNFEPQENEPEALRCLLERRPFRRMEREFWSETRWREHRWAYARLTERVDGQIGRILHALEDSGQAGNTIVVFTSDHGDMDSAHRMEHKSTLYEESCRIPLIIRHPGGVAGQIDTEHLVSNGLDLFPMFCAWTGASLPEGLPGWSLRDLVEGRAVPEWREAVHVESAVGRAVITSRYKYVRYDLSAASEQIYDLEQDPGEMHNFLNDPEAAAQRPRLERLFNDQFGSAPRDPARVFEAAVNS